VVLFGEEIEINEISKKCFEGGQSFFYYKCGLKKGVIY
jgi:hypothetical protein